MSFVHGNDGFFSVVGKRSRSAYIFELPCSCRSPAGTWLRGPVSRRHHSARPSDVGQATPRWWSWYDRCKGAEEAESASGLSSTSARGRARRVPRGWGDPASTSPAPAIRHIARRLAAIQPAPRRTPLTDTAPPASQTPLPPPHSSPSVPDLAPSHHTHFHLRFCRRFRRKM